ncbi:PdxT/SNO family [Sphaerosporella brunnea]|uniref:glutaminase n=1 Tax=Sphaerosporella brunnea TaxID=1250544 RepID=A0A5J5EDP8_9PEZI|nr:PdxT/SNO family [Sphaerosporella brunnea]
MSPTAITETSSEKKAAVVGVLALQGAFQEHVQLLRKAAAQITSTYELSFTLVKTTAQLAQCSALVIPGGESTTMALIAERCALLEPLREFVKVARRPTWGTCAGMILLSESANRTKKGGQELIGGLDVRVNRNHFGRQVESFSVPLQLRFLGEGEKPFTGVFIRAPVVEAVLPRGDARVVAVRQGNVLGCSFHPELTGDVRMHKWWLETVIEDLKRREKLGGSV